MFKWRIHSSLRVWNSSLELGVGSAVIGDPIEGVGDFSSTGLTPSSVGFVFEMLGSGASDLLESQMFLLGALHQVGALNPYW